MNAKIFVVCHDPKQIDDRIFQYPYVPICVGAKKDEFSPRFLRDDRGDNIADKNDVYNEMTAVYSVCKHIDEFENTDLIGFVHYRRFFAFSSNAKIYNERSKFTDEFFDEIKLDEEKLNDIFSKYDFVAPVPAYRKSVGENFKKAHGDDLNVINDIIDKQYPEFSAAKNEYFCGNKAYFFNMFVFKKDTFKRYCDLIFPILFEYEKRRKNQDDRMFVSERLTGAFITLLEKEGQKGCFLPVTCVLKKASLKHSLKNIKKSGGKSALYAIKPVVEWLAPRRVMLAYRKKKFDKFADFRTKL